VTDMRAGHRTDRLVLEALEVRHTDALHDALRDPAVHEFIETSGPWTRETVRRRLEQLAQGPPPGSDDVWLNYVVLLGDRLVGRVEATVHGPLAEVAYLFDPGVSGHGYATESVEWLLGHLRDDHAVTEVWATVDPRNTASIRLLDRCGFAQRATVPSAVQSYDEGDAVYSRSLV
jgi:RimJ/RimL family protein N-acetyltransferase